jgi:hypothetical protein
VAIFLFQVAEELGCDLMDEVREKMNVNREREWRMMDDGSFQHVE